MSVRVTDDLRWLNECYPVRGKHLHVSVFLLDYDDTSVLVDTGSYYHSGSIQDELERALDGERVDTVFVSNPDYVHAGNIASFVPESEVVCFVGTPERHGYTGATTRDPGESMTVGGREFSFLDPIVSDIASSVWIYDHGAGYLFTSDGFGHYHAAGDCDRVSTEFESGILFQEVRDFHEDTLRWLKYVDPSAIRSAVEKVFGTYDVQYVLPAHGHPIAEPDIPSFVESFDRAVREIVAESDLP